VNRLRTEVRATAREGPATTHKPAACARRSHRAPAGNDARPALYMYHRVSHSIAWDGSGRGRRQRAGGNGAMVATMRPFADAHADGHVTVSSLNLEPDVPRAL
jgi:hypothetical protein